MTRQQAEQFISAYNALLTIPTRGEDTKTMAQILITLEQLGNSITIEEDSPVSIVKEPSEMEGE